MSARSKAWQRAYRGAWRRLAARCARMLNRGGWTRVRPADVLAAWDSLYTHRRPRPWSHMPLPESAQAMLDVTAQMLFRSDWADLDFSWTRPPPHVREPRRARRARRWARSGRYHGESDCLGAIVVELDRGPYTQEADAAAPEQP